VSNGPEGEQENDGGTTGDEYQPEIDSAVHALFATAALTLGEVLLVVLTHLRRKAGDVIPPSSEYLAYNSIHTCLCHKS
jgi:hypothetical protein